MKDQSKQLIDLDAANDYLSKAIDGLKLGDLFIVLAWLAKAKDEIRTAEQEIVRISKAAMQAAIEEIKSVEQRATNNAGSPTRAEGSETGDSEASPGLPDNP